MECHPSSVQIVGIVQALDNSQPTMSAQIKLNDTVITTTKTNGEFSFTAPPGQRRLAITVHDTLDNLVDTTKVVTITPHTEGHVFVNIQLVRKAPNVNILASEGNILELGNEYDNNVFAEIVIPPNAIYFFN